MKFLLKVVQLVVGLFLMYFPWTGQAQLPDQEISFPPPDKRYDFSLDTLEYKASQKKFTRFFYDMLIRKNIGDEKNTFAADQYTSMAGKRISEIEIIPLGVFGPEPGDTTSKKLTRLEKAANYLHTKSNLNTLRKMLMFSEGDLVQPEILLENERIIRSLPYIQDVRFLIEQDTLHPDLAKVRMITRDRFSMGISGGVNGVKSADLEVYNQNIFGVGHEISFRFVGHLHRQPYTGLETFYKINNIRGKFIDISAGYMNTYSKEGFSVNVNKPFITPMSKWGYGLSALRMFRSDRIPDHSNLTLNEPADLSGYDGWLGKSVQISQAGRQNFQMVFSTGIYNRIFFQKPFDDISLKRFFANRTLYTGGISVTKREYIRDQLVFSYGITEDIPRGFKNELIYGYEANESGDRHYVHLFFANGSLLPKGSGYLYISAGAGSYFRGQKQEQGLLQGNLSFISKMLSNGTKKSRLFIQAGYLTGINRFSIEKLNLSSKNEIRGFSSDATGIKKLSIDLEYVIFLQRQLYKFSMAVYGFADLGIIGYGDRSVFNQNYYTGIGAGLRLHNENLVLKTFQFRLAFYPLHPPGMGFAGFVAEEQLKRSFYSFAPNAPQPLRFE